MAGKNNRMKKAVRDVKGEPTQTLEINTGNVPILTVKLLNQINNNIVKLIEIANE